jgi:N-methylhydantoinase A
MVERDLLPGDLRQSLDRVNQGLDELEGAARRQLSDTVHLPGQLGQAAGATRTVGLRFYRQIHRIDLPLGPQALGAADVDGLLEEFSRRYERLVGAGTARAGTPVEIVNLGVHVAIPVPEVGLPRRPSGTAAPARSRSAWFEGTRRDCPVFSWDALGAGQTIEGPAFVESAQSTVVVYPDHVARVDEFANIRIADP